MKKKLTALCALSLIFTLLSPGAAQAAGRSVLRIGLAYGSNVRAVSSLVNVKNSGYRLGYYDGDLSFHELGRTEETKISIAKTSANLYLTSGGIYTYTAGGVGKIGMYHVQLPDTYSDYDAAQAAADASGGFVAWVEGTYYVRQGSYTTQADAQAAADALALEGASVQSPGKYAFNVVPTGKVNILFQYDGGQAGERYALGVEPGLQAEVKAVTTFTYKSESYFGGFRFERIGGDKATVVNVVTMDDYVKGIVPYEMSASWPLEALKAQAVCARTYATSLSKTKHSSYHFDLCPTTDCQAYHGTARATDLTNRAVDETAGQLALYNGKPIDAVYSSSHGGGSEDAKNVWGSDVPYLKGVVDPYEEHALDYVSVMGNYKWTKVYTASSLKARLHEKGYQCADIVSFTGSKSPTGNTIEIKIVDSKGKSWTFSRAKIRSVLAVNSIRFDIIPSGGTTATQGAGYTLAGETAAVPTLDGLYAIDGDGNVAAVSEGAYAITGDGVEVLVPSAGKTTTTGEVTYTLDGKGWGHSVGMSQWGAYAMAKMGYDYLDILHFYYTGITVE